ncbi:MAG: OmpA family protein, partial [Flavobacteriales bacterium]
DEFAEYLVANPSITIEIRGHTDNTGGEADNMALSMDRAFEVKGYLEKMGIAGRRIKAKGYGESKPVGDNNTTEGKAKNRRTEFVIISM